MESYSCTCGPHVVIGCHSARLALPEVAMGEGAPSAGSGIGWPPWVQPNEDRAAMKPHAAALRLPVGRGYRGAAADLQCAVGVKAHGL